MNNLKENFRKKHTIEDLLKLTEQIKDNNLKNIVIDFINNPLPTHNEVNNTNISFEQSPGSIRWHHKYEGGLIEHTISVVKLALNMAKTFEEVYNLNLNKDLIIAGGILHDLMKPQNYNIINEEDDDNINGDNNKYDHIKNFHLEHLILMTSEMYKRNLPMNLIKVVCSHHGEYGPMKPDSIEGWLIHYADNIDSSLNNIAIRIGQSRAKELGISENELYNLFTPLKLYELRSTIGKDKLKEDLKEIFNNEENEE